MAKKNGSTPFTPEQIAQLEHFYSLPLSEQTALLADDPRLAADNIRRHERASTLGRTEQRAELTRLHRLTAEEADLIHAFRLLTPEAQQAIGDLLDLQASRRADDADNVVRFPG